MIVQDSMIYEVVIMFVYGHCHTMCKKDQQTTYEMFSDLFMLRSVSKQTRNFVREFAHMPLVAYKMFLLYTKLRCQSEICSYIKNSPISSIDLKIKHDSLSRKLCSIANQEAQFYKMNEEWVEWANREWCLKNSFSHAIEIAITSACNDGTHYELIHKMYTKETDTIKLQKYVYCKISQLASININ